METKKRARDNAAVLYVHDAAAAVWPKMVQLLRDEISRRGLSYIVLASPDPIPATVDFALIPGKAIEAGWLTEHRPEHLILPHAGVPPKVQAAVKEAGGVPGGVFNVHHNSKSTGTR